MGMKEAFETFFEEMDKDSLAYLGKLPRIPYREGKVSKELVLTETLENGYAVWRPKLQEKKYSFDEIEKELGFEINKQIKDYLNTYWFRTLDAAMRVSGHKVFFSLHGVIPGIDFSDTIRHRFNISGAHYLKNHHYYLMGTYCKVDKLDSFLVHVNNETGEVTAVEAGDRVSIKLADSIEELLITMKGKWKEI